MPADFNRKLSYYSANFRSALSAGKTIEEMVALKLKDRSFVAVLDVGTGSGLAMNQLNDAFPAEVASHKLIIYGNDIQKQGTIHKFKYKEGDILHQSFAFRFNIIFAHESLHYMPDKIAAIAKIYSLLKPGGEAYIHLRTDGMDILLGNQRISFQDYLAQFCSNNDMIYVGKGAHTFTLRLRRDRKRPDEELAYFFLDLDFQKEETEDTKNVTGKITSVYKYDPPKA
ncbi:class I SAM-dependent methyltransferase [Candidatus Margulisiibacteriota bacterium]